MNEEEQESLEILKGLEFDEYDWYVKTDKFEGHANEVVEKVEKAMKTILNLIEKQQKEIEKRLKEIDSLYKMMSAKDDKIEQMKEDYQIFKDDIEGHKIVYVDTPEFEENYISKDKIMKKIDLIDKEYSEIIEKNKNDLYLVNINAQRHNAMQSILEELLGE